MTEKYPFGHPLAPTGLVVAEIHQERLRQDAKWGEQNHPDGTGGPELEQMAGYWRAKCNTDHGRGEGTWLSILLEEVFEALAESDPVKLRAELIQVGAVCAAWAESIDRRGQ